MLVAWLALALSDRAGAAAHAGPVFSLSLIHHHLLICSALFTSIVSFHHCPASQRLSHRCLPRTLMHLRSVLPPHITTFDPNSFSLLSQTRLCSLGLSGAIFQDAPSLCLFLNIFLLPLRQETPAMLSLGSALAAVLWQKTLERACLEEDSEGKRALMGGDESLCHVCGWQLAQPSSSHTEETSVRDGQKKGRKCSPDWDGIAKS